MMKMKIFWQKDCPNCPGAKDIGKILEEELAVQYYDVNTVDGLAEACIYQVMSTPSIVLVTEKGKEIESWRGILPEIDCIRKKIPSKSKN